MSAAGAIDIARIRRSRLQRLLAQPGFYEAAAGAGAGEVLHDDRRRAVDAAQIRAIQEALSDVIAVRCRKSTLILGREELATGKRSHVNLPCGSLYCPDCAPLKKSAWDRALNKYKWQTVLYATMRPGLQDWRRPEHVDHLFASFARFRRKVKHLRSLCPSCRANCRASCDDCELHGRDRGGLLVCDRCWVKTARRRRNCPDCKRGAVSGWFGYAVVPEWNTHKPGRRGKLHANILSDVVWGEFTRSELSAILEHAGFGWACKMVRVVDVSHALKELSARQLEAHMLGRAGARFSMSEAVRYGLKDLDEGARHEGALGRYPRGRRRITSNVVHLDRRLPDPRFIRELLSSGQDLLRWYGQEQADRIADGSCLVCAQEVADYPELAGELEASGGCMCDNGAHGRAPPDYALASNS